MADFMSPQFQDADIAREVIEAGRWPDGPVCPHCQSVNKATKLGGRRDSKRPGRKGLYKCNACRKQFTVTINSIFEDSHVPLNKWLYAIHILCASKKGMSAHQLWRMAGFGSYRTAWFVFHRIRWAMGQEPMTTMLEGTVQADEAYIGGYKKGKPGIRYDSNKTPVFTLKVSGGNVRSFQVERVTSKTLWAIMEKHVSPTARVVTDDGAWYRFPKNQFEGGHHVVKHNQGEYARRGVDGELITTNEVESFFATLKRGITGVYHHIGRPYINQYLREFDFRHNFRKITDAERAAQALKQTAGKRLTLKQPKAARQ